MNQDNENWYNNNQPNGNRNGNSAMVMVIHCAKNENFR